MTEVPEHLLARSKSARAKAAGGDAGGSEPPATPGEAPGTGAAATAVEPAGGSEVAPAAAAVAVEPATPVPHYVAAAQNRKRVPRFAIPVLAALPVWALIYAGAMSSGGGPEDPELALGAEVYAAQCSGCHGAGGEGGTGRALDEVLLTFPSAEEHVAWVVQGSPEAGTPYGDPARPGGQRISQSGGFGAMPGFEGTLSPEEIAAVVRYERETLGGGEPAPTNGEPEAAGGAEAEGVQEPESDEGSNETAEAEGQGGNVGGDGGTAGTDGDSGAPSDEGGETDGNASGGGGTGAGAGGQPR